MPSLKVSATLFLLAITCPADVCSAGDPKLEVVAEDDFQEGSEQWEFLDPKSWKLDQQGDRGVLSLHQKKSNYKPPHRSPFHVALLREPEVGDFTLTVDVKSTVKDYGHRDVCLFFGYVDSAHFYYVHIGKKTDPHCNQIFIVNDAARKAISLTTTEGTSWDDEWHKVKIVREVESGSIQIYFDDFEKPIMTAQDKTFGSGRVGLGSFDDTAEWDNFQLQVAPSTADVTKDEE